MPWSHTAVPSLSASSYLAIHETSREDILKWADAAMYQAKDAGRNAVQFYSAKSQP